MGFWTRSCLSVTRICPRIPRFQDYCLINSNFTNLNNFFFLKCKLEKKETYDDKEIEGMEEKERNLITTAKKKETNRQSLRNEERDGRRRPAKVETADKNEIECWIKDEEK